MSNNRQTFLAFVVLIVILVAALVMSIRHMQAHEEVRVVWGYTICQDTLYTEGFDYNNYYVVVSARFDDSVVLSVPVDVIEGRVVGQVFARPIHRVLVPGNQGVLLVVMGVGDSYTTTIAVENSGAETFTINGSTTYPYCGIVPDVDTGVRDIGIYATPGACYYAFIHNPDGGWSLVADEAHPAGIIWRADEYGNIHLITGGWDQSHKPEDYRLEQASCE